MEVITKFDASVKVRAALDEGGEVKVDIVASAPYRDRETGGPATVAATIPVTDEALLTPLREALRAVFEKAPAIAGRVLAQEIHKARTVAANRKEG